MKILELKTQAIQGNFEAMYILAMMYYEGKLDKSGKPSVDSLVKANNYFYKLANKGSYFAQGMHQRVQAKLKLEIVR